MAEPTTRAGRELLRSFREPDEPFTNVVVRLGVLAIEREAAEAALARVEETLGSVPHLSDRDTYEEGWLDAMARVRAAIRAERSP